MIRYNIYPSLLDAWTGYVNADATWDEYWGFSENPKCSPEEWREQKRRELIDRINRVPRDSEAADKGTAFNALIDWKACGKRTEGVSFDEWRKGDELMGWRADYNGRSFYYPRMVVNEVAAKFEGAMPQLRVEGEIATGYGDVLLYGYADYVKADRISDLKTTASYSVGKYKNGWQHVVYPFCLRRMGADIRLFEYSVVCIGKADYGIYEEDYWVRPEEDEVRIRGVLESFIEFLEQNRQEITDEKIFAYRYEPKMQYRPASDGASPNRAQGREGFHSPAY